MSEMQTTIIVLGGTGAEDALLPHCLVFSDSLDDVVAEESYDSPG